MLNLALVGCGLIGRKRLETAKRHAVRLRACVDPVRERAQAAARAFRGAEALTDWRQIVGRKDVDAVLVATPHHLLAPITLAAVHAGKHVLVEKPGARAPRELIPVLKAAGKTRALVRLGFNHRYLPGIRKAKELCDSGALGELMYIRARYGHGGRPGYEKEWRADPRISGGGELIDQGMHVIDLSRWFLGDFKTIQGCLLTSFWKMPVEDNAFLILRTPKKQAASLHVSWSEWVNLFSFEIFGRLGKLEITGRGGSYGEQRLTHYKMKPSMGPPSRRDWTYPEADASWAAEFADFMKDIRVGRRPSPGLGDAFEALKIVETVYKESRR